MAKDAGSERRKVHRQRSAGHAVHGNDNLRRGVRAQAGRHNQVDLRGIAEEHLSGSAVERHRHSLARELGSHQRRDGAGASGPGGKGGTVDRALYRRRLERCCGRNHKRDRNGAGSREWPRVHRQVWLGTYRARAFPGTASMRMLPSFCPTSATRPAIRCRSRSSPTRSTPKVRRRNSGPPRNSLWSRRRPARCSSATIRTPTRRGSTGRCNRPGWCNRQAA